LNTALSPLRREEVSWRFACPSCRHPLDIGVTSEGVTSEGVTSEASIDCASCGATYEWRDGILSLLPAARREYFANFLREYTHIRLAEGRGAQPASYYTRLPECDATHPLAWQWRVRRGTVRAFDREIAPSLRPQSKILDLGAGCGWFSNHLAGLGHYPCAIDVTIDDQDGLGAARHYQPRWPLIQAEFDRLPFEDESVEMVVYNASLHYSTDYAQTLREALRVLRPGGSVVVLESPVYAREESGRRMAAERHAQFERSYGTRSESIPSIEYLTWDMLDSLARQLGLHWRILRPWYGFKWVMRPWIARLRRRREPSRFVILAATRPGSAAGCARM
jgi:SAM-dependent methyltransferase